VRVVANDPALGAAQLNELYAAVGWNEQGERTNQKTRLLLARSAHFVAAWQGAQLVGFGRVLADVYFAQILDVMTHPEYRRQGVARRVVAELVAFAEREELGLVLIAAGDAVALYEAHGFMRANPHKDVLMYRPQPVSR
jgi:ribosomal protein S18 acetylase RimI-like enzyme